MAMAREPPPGWLGLLASQFKDARRTARRLEEDSALPLWQREELEASKAEHDLFRAQIPGTSQVLDEYFASCEGGPGESCLSRSELRDLAQSAKPANGTDMLELGIIEGYLVQQVRDNLPVVSPPHRRRRAPSSHIATLPTANQQNSMFDAVVSRWDAYMDAVAGGLAPASEFVEDEFKRFVRGLEGARTPEWAAEFPGPDLSMPGAAEAASEAAAAEATAEASAGKLACPTLPAPDKADKEAIVTARAAAARGWLKAFVTLNDANVVAALAAERKMRPFGYDTRACSIHASCAVAM